MAKKLLERNHICHPLQLNIRKQENFVCLPIHPSKFYHLGSKCSSSSKNTIKGFWVCRSLQTKGGHMRAYMGVQVRVSV